MTGHTSILSAPEPQLLSSAVTNDGEAHAASPARIHFTQAAVSPFTASAPAMLPVDEPGTSSPREDLPALGEENSGAVFALPVGRGFPHETPAPPAALTTDPRPIASDWRIEEANRRLEILQTYQALVAEGLPKSQAARQTGQGYVTLWRWEKRHQQSGFNGLLPDTDKCGRKSTFQKLGLTQEAVETIRQTVQGINLDTNSITAALRLFAQDDQYDCPPELANVILNPNKSSKHAMPPSLRAAAQVPEPARLAHRGPRKLSLGGIWTPRKLDILPGDIFSADDTTPIWAWWVPWQQSDEYPFGVKLLQGQFIPVIDVASQMIVSFVIIAREKSSYRAADIWHLFGHTFDTVGIPRLGFQLERGSWESNLIRGQAVEIGEGEVSIQRRVGGLRQLPTTITDWHRAKLGHDFAFPKTLQTWTSYLPKSKSVEAWFNRSQNMEGMLWGALGRDQMRAPFEKAKKQFQTCQRGSADPREHFLSATEIVARLRGLIQYVNNEPMEGEVFCGVPEQRFTQAITEHPLGYLPEELQYLYKRDWTVLTITQGWARVRLSDPMASGAATRRYSLFYCHPRVFAENEGREVAVYYDRENFEQPAQIIDAKTGEHLCTADYHDRKGSFLDSEADGHELRKAWRNAVMSIYGDLAAHAPSRQLPPEIAARREAAKASGAVTTTVDGRPAAAPLPQRSGLTQALAPTTPEQFDKQRNRLARQAELARRLNGLTET